VPVSVKDSDAKSILARWPQTTAFWQGSGTSEAALWLRARPKTGRVTHPCIKYAGSDQLSTEPDGMYIRICEHLLPSNSYVDVIAIEHSNTGTNVNDKRSRYSPALPALQVHIPKNWLAEDITTLHKQTKPRWQAAGLGQEPTHALHLPIRNVRVLFSLQDEVYASFRRDYPPAGHEYFCKHSSLGSITSDAFRQFLEQMNVDNHFYNKR
jgi:hypothetical protein